MKYKNWLFYVPWMLIVGFVLVIISDQTTERTTSVGFWTKMMEFGEYSGDLIRQGGTKESADADAGTYNGTDLKDNGQPYCIKVNKTQNVVTIYKVGADGYYNVPVKAMVCSVGETGNTPTGVFDLGDRAEWLPLEGDVYGQYAVRIAGDILFHSVPYFTQDKADLEIEEYNKLGQSVSAGCVRLSVIDAKWIYDHCAEMTYVEIFESDYEGPLGKPVAAVVSSGGLSGNWDPTDPDRTNPYMGNIAVILGAYDREVNRGADFSLMSGVTALDSEGNDITSQIEVSGDFDVNTAGTYRITYTVTDSYNTTATAVANVIVKDEEPPVLVVDQKVERIGMYDVKSSGELLDMLLENVTAYDGNEQLPTESIIVDYSEIFRNGYGKCNVKYQAKDAAGNESEVLVLTVDVDMEAPQLALKNSKQGPIPASSIDDDDYMLGLVKATDNSGSVEVTLSRPLFHMPGTPYVVVYCATDTFGNATTLSVTYQVED